MPKLHLTLTHMRSIIRLTLVLLAGSVLFSCKSSKELTQQAIYFKEITDSVLRKQAIEYEPVLQKGDILSIAVITPNENSSKLFNRPNATEAPSGNEGSTGTSSGGYLIDEKGEVSIPFVGNVHAAGLTRKSFTDTLTAKLKHYIDAAGVTVRLINYRITILGEVAKPGTYTIPSERVSVLDAIGLAGDLTIYGKRNNIRIIRQTNEGRETGTLDINKGDIFGSPYYFLRQNDIVYVEMNERKIPSTDQTTIRTLGVALGIISALGVIVSTINIIAN